MMPGDRKVAIHSVDKKPSAGEKCGGVNTEWVEENGALT